MSRYLAGKWEKLVESLFAWIQDGSQVANVNDSDRLNFCEARVQMIREAGDSSVQIEYLDANGETKSAVGESLREAIDNAMGTP